MLEGSFLNYLNLVSVDDSRNSKLMDAQQAKPRTDSDSESFSSDDYVFPTVERRIVVANQLPIQSYRDAVTKEWSFEFDNDSLYLQLKDGFSPDVEVFYVGSLKVEIDPKDQDEVSQILLEKFRCVPTFLPPQIHNLYYHGFCKHYLWPLFHYMLPMSPSQNSRFDGDQWRAYVSANKIFADKVMEILNEEDDYVWVHDYHLLILPTLLRRRVHRVKLGFFLHNTFPSSEIFRTIPVRDEILKAMLNCDLIGFHTFDYARHFLSCCSRMLGLDYELKRGYIGLDYYGRTVTIKILPVGIHMGQLESVLKMPQTRDRIEELKKQYEGKTVILGVDDMDLFKGIGLKFLAMKHLLDNHERLRGRVVLVQILNPARSRGQDIQDVQNETHSIAQEINEKYGDAGYNPIVFVNDSVSTQEKVAYYAISECCVVNAVRDGMNLVPYLYTVCRQGVSDTNKSVIVVSEFIGCSPSLSGAIRVNPWNVEVVADAMYFAINMSDHEKECRHEKHYKYISSHDVAYWARSFDQDLERACSDHHLKKRFGVGLGLGFRVVAIDPSFKKLTVGGIASAYKNTNNRLILLDYDGTMMPQYSVDKAPSDEVISVLNSLCSDPKNTVFIVSGRDKNCLSKWFSDCEKLGLSAEHGFFTRWSIEREWEECGLVIVSEWKKIAEPVMAHYTEATDGSFIEQKESALVWHHQEADTYLGSCQAKELLDHLDGVLANEPVAVKRGDYIVEVKPQGVSKGIAVERLIRSMRSEGKAPDFVLCIGDDRSDEDMFESISRLASDPNLPDIGEIFACTVGQKPSMAKFYLDDTFEVISLLQELPIAAAAIDF